MVGCWAPDAAVNGLLTLVNPCCRDLAGCPEPAGSSGKPFQPVPAFAAGPRRKLRHTARLRPSTATVQEACWTRVRGRSTRAVHSSGV